MARTIAELSIRCEVLEERIEALRTESKKRTEANDRLIAHSSELNEKYRDAQEARVKLQGEVDLLRHRVDETTRRSEELARRLWTLIPVFLSALLALSSGLIVTLVKR